MVYLFLGYNEYRAKYISSMFTYRDKRYDIKSDWKIILFH